jgi:cytosine/adenosine deaminase-related metal-dependent hydrolase
MVLNNVRLIPGNEHVHIFIEGENIVAVSKEIISPEDDQLQFDFSDAIAFPGLINSHDHLDFNCFSPLGNSKYENYTAWAKDIHENFKTEIDAVLAIPQALRAQWGMYKNLLAGVTTVVNHGNALELTDPLITILQDAQSLHSVKFQKHWKWKLNNPLKKNTPCVIHTGEGIDEMAVNEIDELLHWNLLNRELIGIHGVAMNAVQAKKFNALVWCPESNRIILNKDADIKTLQEHTAILFGTDSTLTGNWNIWHQLRLARDTGQVNDAALFEMLTTTPSKIWGMNNGEIRAGKQADIVIAKTKNGNYSWDSFYKTNPADILMIIHHGKIRLIDPSILNNQENSKFNRDKFSAIYINDTTKYVEGNLPALANAIKSYYPGAVFPFTA